MPDPVVSYTVADRVAHVRMERPRYRNAQSERLLRELDAAFTRATTDRDVGAIVLSGAGDAFSSGHDLGTPDRMAERTTRAAARPATSEIEDRFDYSWELFVDTSLRWRDLPKPTIAAVHGWCIFGGWLIASSMDLIVAADDARFLTSLLQYFCLPYDVGPRKAKELLFDGREITAEEAHDLGFVSRVVSCADLEAEATAFAARIASGSPFWLRMAKMAVNNAQDAAGFRAAVVGAHAQYLIAEADRRQLARREDPSSVDGPLRRHPRVAKLLGEES